MRTVNMRTSSDDSFDGFSVGREDESKKKMMDCLSPCR